MSFTALNMADSLHDEFNLVIVNYHLIYLDGSTTTIRFVEEFPTIVLDKRIEYEFLYKQESWANSYWESISDTSGQGFAPTLVKVDRRVRQPPLKLVKSWEADVVTKVRVEAVKDFAGQIIEVEREGIEEVMIFTNHIIPHDAQMPFGYERADMMKVQVFFPQFGVELDGQWSEVDQVLVWQDELPKSWFTNGFEWAYETQGNISIAVYDRQGHKLDWGHTSGGSSIFRSN